MCHPPGHQSPIGVLVTSQCNVVHDTSIYRIRMIWILDSSRKDRQTMGGLRKESQIHNLSGQQCISLPSPLSLTLSSPQFLNHSQNMYLWQQSTVPCKVKFQNPNLHWYVSYVADIARIMYCYSHEQMQETRCAVAFEATALQPVSKCCLP